MIDFTDCPVDHYRAYGGVNGRKINITYQGHSYTRISTTATTTP